MRGVVLLLVAGGVASAAAPAVPPTPEQREQLAACSTIWRRGQQALKEGRHEEAFAAMGKVVAIERGIFGEWHMNVDGSAALLANALKERGEWRREAEMRRVVLEGRIRLDGPRHWLTVDARLLLIEAEGRQKMTAPQHAALARAEELRKKAAALSDKGERAKPVMFVDDPLDPASPKDKEALGHFEAALRALDESLALLKGVVGERHHLYAFALGDLAGVRSSMGDHEKAIPLHRKALELREATVGEGHSAVADSLSSLALACQRTGRLDEALPLMRRAVRLDLERYGPLHPKHAGGLEMLAGLLKARGEYKEALALRRRVFRLKEKLMGEGHPYTATSIANVAALHAELGEFRQALSLAEKALAIIKKRHGMKHFLYAQSLELIAHLRGRMGDHELAVSLLRQVVKIKKEAIGERNPHYGAALLTLATQLQAAGHLEAALPLMERGLKIRHDALGRHDPFRAAELSNLASLHASLGDPRGALPVFREALGLTAERHPQHAITLSNLAGALQALGDHEAAMANVRKALGIFSASLGDTHPRYAVALHHLAWLHMAAGRPGAALPLQERSLALSRRHLELDAAVQSERQQLAAADVLRYRLALRLSMPEESARFSHDHVVSWKGASFAAQQSRRLFVAVGADAATRRLAAELLDVTRALARATSAGVPRARLEELARVKEENEAALSEKSESFRASRKPATSERLRASLPAGVALIDMLAYDGYGHTRPWKGQARQRRLAAWVLRRDAPAVRVDLGPIRPVEEAVTAWRESLEKGGAGGDAPAKVRRLAWSPLEKHLAGAKLVLVSPDGALGKVPFAALPGRKAGTYLIEEVPLAILPVPQVLPGLMKPVACKRSLLALGGVDFGGSGPWVGLPATVPEIAAVKGRFLDVAEGPVTALTGEKATEGALREALPRHRYAHLATHGFFAPGSMRPALGHGTGPGLLFGPEGVTGWNPGLLSGIVLAGANRPTADDDGVLTASEIAEMDLSNLELAVLSACQTGLGKEAAGEGMLGLQRAFAVAGCRSVVSSLWSVNDAATSLLMERFYHHLWEKKLLKVEALRRAQLDVLENPARVERRMKALGSAGVRALGKAVPVAAGGRQSPPAWWAAWQLSGDWR